MAGPSHTDPLRAFIADTTALILFFTKTGIINERFAAGMAWEQVLHARLLETVLMLPVGRPYGVWRYWLCRARDRAVYPDYSGTALPW